MSYVVLLASQAVTGCERRGPPGPQGPRGPEGAPELPLTGADIQARLANLSASGTRVDADTLDGLDSTAFMRTDGDTATVGHLSAAALTVAGETTVAEPTAPAHAATKGYVDAHVVANWVDVKSCGAAGDGVTDDTEAIRAAFGRLVTGGQGATLYFPPGVYRVTDEIAYGGEANFTVLGARGRDSVWSGSTLEFDGASGTILNLEGSDFFRVSSLRLDGKHAATRGLAFGFSSGPSHPSHIVVEDVTIQNIAGSAIDTGVTAGFMAIADSRIEDVIIETAYVGIDFGGGQAVKVENGTIAGCSEAGIKSRPSSTASFEGTIFTGNGVDIEYTGDDTINAYSFVNVWFENSFGGIFARPLPPSITKGVSSLTFTACHLHSSHPTSLLDLTNVEGHVFVHGGKWASNGAGTITLPAGAYLSIDTSYAHQLTYAGANALAVMMPAKNYLRSRAYPTVGQSIPTSAWTTVAFDAESYDVGGKFDPGTGRYEADAPGVYEVKAKVQFASSAAGAQYLLGIRKNGAALIASNRVLSPQANAVIDVFLADDVYLSPSDLLEVVVYHDSGSARDLAPSPADPGSSSYFAIHRVN